MAKQRTIGILGAGQLGRMLIQAASNYDVNIYAMDQSLGLPASAMCNKYFKGGLKDYDAVMNFGRMVDVLTIEIEHVNAQALIDLEAKGVICMPSGQALQTIQDKGLQKDFYAQHQLPTAPYELVAADVDWSSYVDRLPFVQKARTEGYDGKGVKVVHTAEDLNIMLPGASVVEQLADIHAEISCIVVRGLDGQVKVFPAVEVVYNKEYNLVDYLLSPARITPEQEAEAQALALKVADAFDSPGIFAVEMFLNNDGSIWVNETAPRPHNSGHQSIEGNLVSQYEQHLRALMQWPLGATDIIRPSIMINLIGENGHDGLAQYEGLEECLALEGVYVHLYGKTHTRPGRKMGHVTIINDNKERLFEVARTVKNKLKVIS